MIITEDLATQILEQIIPLHNFLGVRLLEMREGYAKLLFPFRAEVVGDPRSGRWHGGMIATALDSVGGAAIMSTIRSEKERHSTIDLRVDYLRGSRSEDIIAEGELLKKGRQIMFCRMWAYHPGETEWLAEGRAAFYAAEVEPENGSQANK